MALTHTAVLNARSKDEPYKLSDGGGLHLLVQTGGSKLWRFRYRFLGKENMLALGSFPEVSLSSARTKRDDAKKLLANGTDPSAQRKLDKITAAVAAANTFGAITTEYLARLTEKGCSEKTVEKNRWLLEDLAAPLKERPISAITPAEILIILQRIEKSGRRESARRLRGIIGSVFRFAVVTLRTKDDPTYALRGALLPPQVQHRPAITDEGELGALMRNIDEYDGWVTLRAALLFLALTMTLPVTCATCNAPRSSSPGLSGAYRPLGPRCGAPMRCRSRARRFWFCARFGISQILILSFVQFARMQNRFPRTR